jgi:pimeloyl-ACP methyl ester carboxylesterase
MFCTSTIEAHGGLPRLLFHTYRLDPSHIVLIGHSMGGFMAVEGAAADPAVAAIGLISAADLGGSMFHRSRK